MANPSATVQRSPAPAVPINAVITVRSQIIVVKKSYTNPARVLVTLRTSARFRRSGSLDRITTPTSGDIRLFTAPTAGTQITFNGTDNIFTAAQLNAPGGVRLFADALTPSSNLDDFQLRLTLAPGPTPVGPPTTVTMTAVLLTLNISPPRNSAAAPFGPLPQPPDPLPAPGTGNDKWSGGAMVNSQDPGNNQRRAEISVEVFPTGIPGDLVLRQVRVSGNNVGGLDNKAQLFDDETPGPRQTPAVVEVAKLNPFEFSAATVNLVGSRFFVQGRNASSTTRDTGFQLGIKGVEEDGDRVAMTVAVAPVLTIDNPIVVVKKPHTSPQRRAITVRASTTFSRTGTLTRSAGGPAIRLLDRQQPAAGTEIVVTGAGHTFNAAQLNAGVQLFAESSAPSGAADDYELTLTLAGGPTPIAPPVTIKLTAVELTLDVALSRPAPGVAPPLMSANDKINTGRFVQVRDPGFSHERAMIILRPPNPPIPLTLVLTSINAQVEAFGFEAAAAGQAAHRSPATFPSGLIGPPGGLELFVEATGTSVAARDTGFRYGIDGLENEGDRVAMTANQFDIAENDAVATPPHTAVRLGLWDNAYDAAGNVRNDFIDNDRRRFHFRVVHAAAGVGPLQMSWRTVLADRTTNDDAPASQLLTLSSVVGSPGRFVSRGVMLVSDDTDAAQATQSGLIPPLVPEPRARGTSDHRLRRARLDGFVSALLQPSAGQFHRFVLPIFDRAVPFNTTSVTNVIPGARVVTPAAMSGTAATGARWSIKIGTQLTIDTGANQEDVVVTAVTQTTFTAVFARPHNGTAAAFQVAGRADERRRLTIRIMRYTNPALPLATAANIAAELRHANQRWNQFGLQIDSQNVPDRPIPAAALNAGIYGGSANNPNEQAALSDLIPVTPDNTLTVVFVPLSAASAYTTVAPRNPIPQPVGAPLTLGDRFFIFINPALSPEDHVLAHELYHALFNRFDVGVPRQFFTFNTSPPSSLGIALPDVRADRRIQNLHTADPNTDPNNDNVINWARRLRTSRFPAIGNLGNLNPAANAETGNRLTADF